jgi:selenium metabolism protein YedF
MAPSSITGYNGGLEGGVMKEFDVRDLACPAPVLKLRELFEEGEREVRFWVADDLCRSNVTRFATSRGAEVTVDDPEDGTYFVTVKAPGHASADAGTGQRPTESETPAVRAGDAGRPLVIQISAATMGSGDDELGGLLLRSFIKTQSQLGRQPDAIIFYNEGVKLCCSDSILLDDLRDLESLGVEIIACGTCLNFFQLGEQLQVGRVTDMLEIAERLAEAGAIVRP